MSEVKECVMDAQGNYALGYGKAYSYNDNSFAFVHFTGNCQSYCIARFNNLLGGNKEAIIEKLSKLDKAVCRNNINEKPQLLVDVNDVYDAKIKEVFGAAEIKIRQPYENANGSRMILYLIDLRHFRRSLKTYNG